MIRKQEITTFDFPKDAVIWDVRDVQSYREGHLKGTVNLPIDEITEQSLMSVSVGQPIYVLCGGGSKAPRAAEKLENYDDSREYVVLMGGMRAVLAAGMPIQS
ncbi:rhodanese-like domain-containing protein [Acinetobacter rathckeae]|uniref:rhodanese-like domain-containing protein n=1 Tax=Acinetobacter rathckeae TaxID=2605272 RepID=UPI0018A2B301|nr:rhodanese-like domain-containing protein [Acinetobacter rathckeae]MBF7689043.1 rhodanese-like domain-containing protein [Acinetobacter rathckeae]MBF7696563.1 rhodanese-like domain-containing protein [Acinetobacter rathckeae]